MFDVPSSSQTSREQTPGKVDNRILSNSSTHANSSAPIILYERSYVSVRVLILRHWCINANSNL